MKTSRKNLAVVLSLSQGLLFLVVACLVALLSIFGAPLFVWFMLIGAMITMATLVVRHAHTTIYECPSCRHTFRASNWTDFISPHIGGAKLLRCPKCRAVSWCEGRRG